MLFESGFHISCLLNCSEFYSELFGDARTLLNTFILFFTFLLRLFLPLPVDHFI